MIVAALVELTHTMFVALGGVAAFCFFKSMFDGWGQS